MGYIGNYKGLDVYDYNGATAAKFASLENDYIYTCSWRTSTEANVYFRGEFFGTLVEKADGGYRMEPEQKPLPVPKETEKKQVPKETEEKRTEESLDLDLYFQRAKESIDNILADLKSRDLDYETGV